MQLKTKLLLITIIPIVVIAIAMLLVINFQSGRLAVQQVSAVESMILNSKETELKNYVKLARTAIDPFYTSAWSSTPLAKSQVSRIMNRMTFGQDGYFFVYEANGTNLVHPRLPELVGKNWIDLKDTTGRLVISDLIQKAKSGGELYPYIWNKPSTGIDSEKIGYSVYLDQWDWMLGSGLYVDDIAAQVSTVRQQLEANIQQTKWILLALTLGAILASSLFIGTFRFSEQRIADAKLRELTKRLVEAQEVERKRVSTELHDGISQLLVSAKYGLDLALSRSKKDKEVAESIEKSMDVLGNAISEVRRISMDLRPSILDDMGLAVAVKSLSEEFARESGLTVSVKSHPVKDLLSDDAKTALYRITQEAFTNISKHSQASNVSISLSSIGSFVCLKIEDDGVGLASAKNSQEKYEQGLGVRNMEERVASFGGTIIFRKSSKGGLGIKVEIPVSNSLKQAA